MQYTRHFRKSWNGDSKEYVYHVIEDNLFKMANAKSEDSHQSQFFCLVVTHMLPMIRMRSPSSNEISRYAKLLMRKSNDFIN